MRGYRLVVVLLIVSFVLALTGCAPKVVKETVVVEKPVEKIVKETVVVEKQVEKVVTATPEPKEPVTISVMTFLAADTPEVEKKIMAEFEKENPGYKVELQFVPYGEYFTKLQTLIAGGTPPDVASLNMENVQSFAALGTLVNLDPYVQMDSYDLGQYYPATVQMHSYQAHLYGLPASFSTVVLFYNKKLFDEAEVAYPDSGWDWDKLIEVGKKLTKDTDGDGRTDQFGYDRAWWPLYLWLNGADLFNEDETRCTLSDPAAVEGIQKMMDLWMVDEIAPTPADLATQGGWDMFTSGRLAMYPTGPWATAPFQEITTFEWDIADHPSGKERATFLFGNAYSILAGSKNPDAAWELIKFAAGEKGERIRQAGGYEIAPVKVVAETEFLPSLAGKTPAHAEVFLHATAYARTQPVVPKWEEIHAAMWDQLELAYLGKKPVKEALADACTNVDAILATIE